MKSLEMYTKFSEEIRCEIFALDIIAFTQRIRRLKNENRNHDIIKYYEKRTLEIQSQLTNCRR